MRNSKQAGVTLVELMVGVGLSAIVTAFAFAIYARSSVAYRSQQRVSEVQQTLRAASDLLVKDIRQAGYLVGQFRAAESATPLLRGPVSVDNNAEPEGSDAITIAYADGSAGLSRVLTGSDTSPSVAWSLVTDASGFQVGDVIAAIGVKQGALTLNDACTLKITNISLSVGAPHQIDHAPVTASEPWGRSGNVQCASQSGSWPSDVALSRFHLRTYRIKPADARGVLQMSPSGGLVANDWVDLVTGVVDLQVSLRVFQPGDVVDEDADGDPTKEWISGDNMQAQVFTKAPSPALLQMRISLVSRTGSEIESATTVKTPDLYNPGMSAPNNDIGDHLGVTIASVVDPTSRYYGKHLYRFSSTIVDMRNLGVGK